MCRDCIWMDPKKLSCWCLEDRETDTTSPRPPSLISVPCEYTNYSRRH